MTDLFIDALQSFDFTAASDAAKGVKIVLGNGNNEVCVIGEDASIKTGNGNNDIDVIGDDTSILTGDGSNKITTQGNNTKIVAGNVKNADSKGNNEIFQVGDKAQISVANGNNKVISYSDKGTILAGNGDNLIGSMGNNVKIGVGNGNNSIAFWGNNDVIDTGNGNNTVVTLDWINKTPEPEDEYSREHNEAIRSIKNSIAFKNDDDIKDMANKVYSTFKSGSKRERDLINRTSSSTTSTYTRGQYRYTTVTTTTISNYLDRYINYLDVKGISNPTVKLGNGNNQVGLTVSDKANVRQKDPSQSGDNKIKVIKGGYQYYTSSSTEETTETTTTSSTTRKYIDPLILDYNQDGEVSALAGQGIDLDGDGQADGAATNGDKMLAMSDINGNKTIDGAEVFGDQTVDPFTGKRLNAQNGFQALELLAKSAQKHTGISCMDSDGNVKLNDLKRALATVGVNLGFVSDANNSKLEELDKVASINVKNYTRGEETGANGQHEQLGTYTDNNGKQYKVHDVWFYQA